MTWALKFLVAVLLLSTTEVMVSAHDGLLDNTTNFVPRFAGKRGYVQWTYEPHSLNDSASAPI